MNFIEPNINWRNNNTYDCIWEFPLEFLSSGETHTIFYNNLCDINSIDGIKIEYSGKQKDRYLRAEFRINYQTGEKSGEWSVWSDKIKEIDPNRYFNIEINIQRSGKSNTGIIHFGKLILFGTWTPPIIEGNEALDIKGKSIILSSSDVWKVFSLHSVDVSGENLESVAIHYRVSQDQGRSWTPWYQLNEHILKELRPDPLRFFIIQYHIEQTQEGAVSRIYKIDLIGDFINVTKNYLRSTRLGIRKDCNMNNQNSDCMTDNPYKFLMEQTSCFLNGFWKPYDKNKAIQLYEFQSKLLQETLGWLVDYYKTDVDRKGRDVILNEYQLFNVACHCKLKVLVPKNKFPENQIEFEGLDLSDLQLFEIHILRDEFKRNFGVESRPEKGDIIFFCENNRLYRVEHSEQQRKFMNATVYYRVMLRKYNKQANLRFSDNVASEQLKSLTSQTTFEELLGKDRKDQYNKFSNKKSNVTLSRDPIRTSDGRKAKRVEYKLICGPNTISERYYDTSTVEENKIAVNYSIKDLKNEKGKGRAITFWFQLQSLGYRSNIIYNWENEQGYFLDVSNDGFYLQLNQHQYWIESEIKIGVWYAAIVQWIPSLKSIEMYLLTRKDEEGYGTDPSLKLIDSKKIEMLELYSWDIRKEIVILGGKINLTHITVWRENIPYEKLLPELTIDKIQDEHMIILNDNIRKRVHTKKIFDPYVAGHSNPSPPSKEEKELELEIKVNKMDQEGFELKSISDEDFLNVLKPEFRIKYLNAKTNIGISDYLFERLNEEEFEFVIENFNFLSNYQFNKLSDENKKKYLRRLASTNNPARQWMVTNKIINYGVIPNDVFALLSEDVIDVVIETGWVITEVQWKTLTPIQKYNYLQVEPRNRLLPTPPQSSSETLSQFDARLNIQFNRLQKLQFK